MKPGKAHLTALVITLALAILIDYVTLPAWNLHSPSTVMLVVFLLVVFGISDFMLSGKWALIPEALQPSPPDFCSSRCFF